MGGVYSIKQSSVEFGFAEVMARVHSVIKTVEPDDSTERYTKLGVDIVEGEAKIISPWEVQVTTGGSVRTLTTRSIVIAAGAHPFVPPIPGLDQVEPLTLDNIWNLRELPKRLLVLGGGPIGCELTQSFARFGSQVTQVEMLPRIMIKEDPEVSEAVMASFLRVDSPVLGLDYQGVVKAYPINILNWHEIVNDQFNGEPVVITFCPLCGSGMAFSASINDKIHTFGVSGLLYNSDVLLYDRQTESLWSQLMTQAISGPHKGKHLTSLPVLHTTWQDWQTRHPNSLVLSTDTGYVRDYSDSPYTSYLDNPEIMFPLTTVSRRYHPKEEVLGLEINGQFKAYPFIELEKSFTTFNDSVNGQLITVHYNTKHRSAIVFNQQGKQLPAVRTFWFAWYAFHPETEVYLASKP